MRNLAVTFFAGALLATSLAKAQGYDPEMVQKVNEEIRFNEDRARDLDPIIARNVQAKADMLQDANQLRAQATSLHGRARWYRDAGARTGGRHREHMMKSAEEMEQNARRNEEMANGQQEIAQRIDGMINQMKAAQNWHREMAKRWRESLGW